MCHRLELARVFSRRGPLNDLCGVINSCMAIECELRSLALAPFMVLLCLLESNWWSSLLPLSPPSKNSKRYFFEWEQRARLIGNRWIISIKAFCVLWVRDEERRLSPWLIIKYPILLPDRALWNIDSKWMKTHASKSVVWQERVELHSNIASNISNWLCHSFCFLRINSVCD